jgi:hypothetical protein
LWGSFFPFLREDEIYYDYSYDSFWSESSSAIVQVTASCGVLCTHTFNPSTVTSPAPTAPFFNKCEQGGFIGGVPQFTPDSSTGKPQKQNSKETNPLSFLSFTHPLTSTPLQFHLEYVVYNGVTLHQDWEPSSENPCNFTVDGIKCRMASYEWMAFVRKWQTRGVVVPSAPYTHFAIRLKTLPGYAECFFGIIPIDLDYEGLATAIFASPYYAERAVDDDEAITVYIPMEDLGLVEYGNIYGFALTSSQLRPFEFIIEDMRFVDMDTSIVPLPQYPVPPPRPDMVGPGPQDDNVIEISISIGGSEPYETDGGNGDEGEGDAASTVNAFALLLLSLLVLFL